MTTPADVMKMAKEAGVKIVDFRFCDLLGTWQHTSKSIADVDEDIFEDGVGFDGSSIRGFQAINESDMLMMPDPTTARIDPYTTVPTMYVLCDIYDPVTRERYSRSARRRPARRGVPQGLPASATPPTSAPSRNSSSSTMSSYDTTNNRSFHEVDSVEGFWNTGTRREGRTSATRSARRPATTRCRRTTPCMDLRSEMVLTMEELGIPVEIHHHEVGTAGQCEIDMRFDTLTQDGRQRP